MAKRATISKGRGKRGSPKRPIPVESIRHTDKRTNIPTEELRDFVVEDEHEPKTMLYPRDPSLDPQLVWKGKDEQDREDLAVPIVPVYIQEKIHPQALIENLRDTAKAGEPEPELTLFDDFNGIEEFDKRVDFYQHEANWSNRLILGDSLLVMTSLAEKEGLKGKIQTIYIDPPYGIKFGSNWQVSTRKLEVKDSKVGDATRQPEQIQAFRDTWKLGVHSYLAYLRDRFTVSHDLLTDTGSIFVQIGDENIHLIRCLLDEVFGSENHCSIITVRKTGGMGSKGLTTVSDFLLWYAKDGEKVKFRQLFLDKDDSGTSSQYGYVILPDGTARSIHKGEELPRDSRRFQPTSLHTMYAGVESCLYSFKVNAKKFDLPSNRQWSTTLPNMMRLSNAGRIFTHGNTPRYIRFLDDFPVAELTNLWADLMGSDDKIYVVQTATRVIQRCILMTTDPGDLVLDPTCGSGTTAYVAEQWGRRWITIDTSRVALALARTRLMSARYPYYILADSPEGIRKEAELTGKLPPPHQTDNDIRKGFVYKRVPHVTLKSIANNPDIKEGMTREEIDKAIARHAERETLYDQPYEDNKRIRVTGPFSVESLSPHRVLTTDEEPPRSEADAQRDSADFATMIIENLKKAGVQNTRKNERLVFDRLEPFAGAWIHAVGEYTEADGKTRRIAVSIGPEHGTVGPQQVKEAAKEAVQGVGFDLLVVCGFAFDAHVNETAKEFKPDAPDSGGMVVAEESRQYGKLPVLLARMNPDLSMGDELLKKTGAGNLFMVFGEPDVDIRRDQEGKIVAEIKGVDVYDPTTGQVRNSSTDDIACWFIDTNYNAESFFVRHAYFTGADEPYKKLQRALRAEINEEAWATLHSTVSRPFDPPETGKIAIKVINHYGDEVLKIFEV